MGPEEGPRGTGGPEGLEGHEEPKAPARARATKVTRFQTRGIGPRDARGPSKGRSR